MAVADAASLRGLFGEQAWEGALEAGLGLRGQGSQVSARVEASGRTLEVPGVRLGTGGATGELTFALGRPREATGSLRLALAGARVADVEVETIEGVLELLPDKLIVPSLTAVQPGNTVRITSLDLPRTSDPEALMAEARGELVLQLTDVPRALGRAEPEPGAPPVPEHRLTATALLSRNRATLAAGELEVPGGSIRLTRGSLRRHGEGQRTGIEIDLEADIDLPDLAPVGALVGSTTWSGSLGGRITASGPVRRPTGSVDLSGGGVRVAGVPLGELEAVLAFDGDRLTIERFEARSQGDLARAGGRVDLSELRFEEAWVEADVADLGPYLDAAAGGSVTARANFDGPLRRLDGAIDLRLGNLDLGPVTVQEASASARVAEGAWRDGQLSARGPLGGLDARFDLRPGPEGVFEGRVHQLQLLTEEGLLALEAPAEVVYGPDRLDVGPLALGGADGSLSGVLRRRGPAWSLRLAATDLAAGRIAPDLGIGTLDGLAALEVGEGLLWGELQLVASDGRVPGLDRRGSLALDAGLAGGRLALRMAEFTPANGGLLRLRGEVPLAPDGEELFPDGPVMLDLLARDLDLTGLDLGMASAWSGGRADLEAELEGGWRDLVGTLRLRGRGLTLPPMERSTELDLRAELSPGEASFELLADQTAGLNLEARGSVDHGYDPRALWSERVDYEPSREATVVARVDARAGELAWLAERLEGVRRLEGALEAELGLTGPLASPDWQGELRLSNGELRLASDFPALAGLEVDLALEGRQVRIDGLTGELGGAPFQVGGRVTLARGREAELDLTFAGERILLRRDRDVLLRADAQVAVRGPSAAPTVTGALELRRSRITSQLKLLDVSGGGLARRERGIPFFSFRQAPLANLRLDLAVRSADPVALRTNVAQGNLRPNLRVTGTGETPRLGGEILLEPTAVSLPGARVQFQSGSLTFDAANPFVPRVALLGSAEKFGYDIRVQVSGPYDAPEIELSSTPPLSSEELLLVLFAGRAPGAEGGKAGAVQAGQTVAVYLAQDVVRTWLDEGVTAEDDSLFDRVEVVLGRELSRNGVPTLEVLLRVREDMLVNDDRVYLTHERDVFEDDNVGVRFAFRLK